MCGFARTSSQQAADLVVVEARGDRRQDRGRHVVLLEQVERLELGLHRVGAEQELSVSGRNVSSDSTMRASSAASLRT